MAKHTFKDMQKETYNTPGFVIREDIPFQKEIDVAGSFREVSKRIDGNMRMFMDAIDSIYGFQCDASPDTEHALRNTLTRFMLQLRADISQEIENAVEAAKSDIINMMAGGVPESELQAEKEGAEFLKL